MNNQLSDYGKPITLNCANCGYSLSLTDDTELFKCNSCGTYVLIRRISTSSLNGLSAKKTEYHSEIITRIILSKKAQYYAGGIWRRGNLTLTETDLIFIPDESIWLPKQGRLVIPLPDILDVDLTMLSLHIDVKMVNGVVMNFEMLGNKGFVKQLLLRIRRAS